ncbi:23S rRNA (uracil(1939)-C(5))-methyltransferase RlmD [Orenia marismortui]|uniref:23S rRNA m(5)U-1939 methyltransferase n=1 Tax=Orenia marismortui TaxID=46469 RepID=A0A4R8HPM2_9FIRM|nr:23S rRNA (uracil(1939)-C(5))-methyltransferase RlmD [Orenia marismortui]TDX58871.1 23S rRNA m(5)U-1939 methyltransferase [Orenia marismortui]
MAKVKKKAVLEVKIEETAFPNMGVAYVDGHEIRVKNALPGQKVKTYLSRKRKNYYKGKLLEVLERSPLEKEVQCPHYEKCGGCSQQSIEYQLQIDNKAKQVQKLFDNFGIEDYQFLGIEPSPDIFEYRNKMEFSFGDLEKGGELQLGMHPRGRRFDIISVDSCCLVDNDFRLILTTVLNYFREQGFKKYHVQSREGYLRNLVVRKGLNTGEILVNLVTTSQIDHDPVELSKRLEKLDYKGELVGFIQTINDDFSDAVKCDELIVHYGREYYYEELLGLKFKVKPFSFFQPNTLGAEKLYSIVKEFLGDADDKLVYDLYCGTGTIGQIVASNAKEVVGIEIVEEAVEMAKENAELNGLDNCRFIAGDVLEKIDKLAKKPDLIIIDPPRAGIHPKALPKIIDFACDEMVYVSCNPRTLAPNLKEFQDAGYLVEKVKCVDMFPHTAHVETVVRLFKIK